MCDFPLFLFLIMGSNFKINISDIAIIIVTGVDYQRQLFITLLNLQQLTY